MKRLFTLLALAVCLSSCFSGTWNEPIITEVKSNSASTERGKYTYTANIGGEYIIFFSNKVYKIGDTLNVAHSVKDTTTVK